MIRQYLPQINQNTTIPKSEIFCKLNKAQDYASADHIYVGQEPWRRYSCHHALPGEWVK